MYQIKARGRLRSKNYLGRINLVRRYWHLKYSVRPCRRAGKSGVSRLLYLQARARLLFFAERERARAQPFTCLAVTSLACVTGPPCFCSTPDSRSPRLREWVDQIQIHRQMVIVILYLVNFANSHLCWTRQTPLPRPVLCRTASERRDWKLFSPLQTRLLCD